MSQRKVVLSPLAEFKLIKILDFLVEEWSVKVKNDFLNTLHKKINHIAEFPHSCEELKEFKGLFKCTVTKHNVLVFRINNDIIEVVTVFDNRQNPEKLNKEIAKHFAQH